MPVYEYKASSNKLNLVAGGTFYADLPIGSWVKNDSDKIPSGFLKEGDTISQTLYPELYAMYGSTVPYKADTSELGDYENITFPTSLMVTAQYDGVIITTAYDGGYLTFNINGHKVYIRTQSSGINAGATTVPFRKGDVISVEGADGNYTINVRYYKKSLIVKAKQVSVPFDVAEYIRKWNELEPIPSVRIGSFNGWTQGDLTQNYTMEHDGIVSVFLDENTNYYVITDLNGSETQIYASTVHGSASSAMSLFLRKGYKIRLSTNSYSGLSIQYYLNRD